MARRVSRPVLCGVDRSPGGRAAARVGAALAGSLGAPLVLVNVAAPAIRAAGSPYYPWWGSVDDPEPSHREATATLRDVAAKERVPHARLRAEVGAPGERLVAVAREERAAMVVIGCRGRGPLAAAVLGSVSAAVIRSAPCPVVVVPPGAARVQGEAYERRAA